MLETVRARWREYLSASSLARHAGVSVDNLALAAAKELVDNAYDVTSPAGVYVSIEDRCIVVRDFGPGLAEPKVVELFAISRDAISSKRWRQARRGALGNGLRVVMGVAHCSGGCLVVESRGAKLALDIDPDGNARIIDQQPSDIVDGTRVTLQVGPKLKFDQERIEAFAKRAEAVSGTAFGGTKAVPQWHDDASLTDLIRDVRPDTSVMEFARQFDLKPDALADIKAMAMRLTTRALLADAMLLDTVVSTIRYGGREPRELKPIGRNTFEGAYNRIDDGSISIGDAELPAIVEIWMRGYPVQDRRTTGKVGLTTFYANRTPVLGLRHSSGTVEPQKFDLSMAIENVLISIPGKVSNLKGPCDYWFTLAITTPDLPLISEGKAVDVLAFGNLIAEAIAPTLKRAYKPPQHTLARKPPKPEKQKAEPHQPGVLGCLHQELAKASGHAPDSLLVLSKTYDPYALDSRPNRRRAEWLAEAMQAVGIADRKIHIRGIFYALVASGDILRDDGRPFVNTDANYNYMARIARHARWLGVIDPELITDERNTPAVIRLPSTRVPLLAPQVRVEAPELVIPASRGKFLLDIIGEDPLRFPSRPQPFHLVLFGEKTSLDPVLGPLQARFNISLFLPSGEISDTQIWQMAKLGSDGRRLIVFTFTDFDPTGNNMPGNIAQKLRACRDLKYPKLSFEVRPVAMLEEDVRRLGLPSTPLKTTEKRASEWKHRYADLEQTEIDALATLQPEVLTRMAVKAIKPFFDASLQRRQQQAEAEWRAAAEARVAALDSSSLAPFEERMAAVLANPAGDDLKQLARRFNAASSDYRQHAEQLVAEVDFPVFVPPEPVTNAASAPKPLVASNWDILEFIEKLQARYIRVKEKKGRDED